MPTDDENWRRPLPTDGPISIWLRLLRALAAIALRGDASETFDCDQFDAGTALHSIGLVAANVHDAPNDWLRLLPLIHVWRRRQQQRQPLQSLDLFEMPQMPTVIVNLDMGSMMVRWHSGAWPQPMQMNDEMDALELVRDTTLPFRAYFPCDRSNIDEKNQFYRHNFCYAVSLYLI